MKKVKIIARQRIINFAESGIHSDEGLRALDSYFEVEKVVNEDSEKLSLIIQLEEQNPEIKGWDFEIIEKE